MIRLTFSGVLLAAGCMAATGPHYYGDDEGTIGNGVDGGGSSCTAVALAVTPVTPAILDKVLDCELAVDGTVDLTQASTGTVKANGIALAITTDWIALDPHTIQLVGAACTAYKAVMTAPEITATFACGATKP